MAVRSSFTAGEVLTAADLTDTFAGKADYPTGGSDGQVISKSGTTTAWVNAGLSLVAKEPFTLSSGVQVNGCFTTSSENYLVMVEFGASNTTSLVARLVASTVPSSGTVYRYQRLYGNASTAGAAYTAADTAFLLNGGLSSTAVNSAHLFVFRPAFATNTVVNIGPSFGSNQIVDLIAGYHDSALAYDGLFIGPIAGTISGTISIYALKD